MPTFYSCFKESFSGEYGECHIYTWRLTKAIAEMKLDTVQTMKLE